MRYFNQSIIALGLFTSSTAYAVEFHADFLYWQASESVDWALTNNLSLPHQIVSYKTIAFNYAPGFRIGADFKKEDWHSRLLYTQYNVKANASTHGNVISVSMPGKFAESFYQSGQVKFTIDFNMFDIDLYKNIHVSESFIINPVIGLRGGFINQRVNTSFQGNISVFDTTTNNFSGVGPKVGIENQWMFYTKNDYHYSLVADFYSSYMWGDWSINDSLTRSNSSQRSHVYVGKRNFGALALQGLMGINLDYKQCSLKIAYEVADWFNQYQVFDNGSGTHTNDLVLQGATVALKYRW